MKNHHIVFILNVFLLVSLSSCKKEDALSELSVELISPSENSLFKLPDTLQIKFKIESEADIESVHISIVNSNYISLFGTNTIDTPQTGEEIVTTITLRPLQNFDNAPYYIRITVNYNEDKRNFYFDLQLENKPLVYQGFFLFSSYGIQQTRIDFYNPNLIDTVFCDGQGNYSDSEISGFYRKLYLLTATPAKLKTFSIEDQVLDWEVEPAFPYPQFTDIEIDKDRIYAGMESSQIVGYAQLNGQKKLITEMLTDSFPEKMFPGEDYLLCDYLSRLNGKRTLVTFYKETGVKKQRHPINFKVVSFARTEYPEKVLVIGNMNQKGIVSLYHAHDNYFENSQQVEEGNITDVCEISEGTLLFLIANGVYLYHYEHNITAPLVTFQELPVRIYFEHISQQVIVQFEKKLLFLGYPEMNEIATLDFDSALKGMQLYYQYN